MLTNSFWVSHTLFHDVEVTDSMLTWQFIHVSLCCQGDQWRRSLFQPVTSWTAASGYLPLALWHKDLLRQLKWVQAFLPLCGSKSDFYTYSMVMVFFFNNTYSIVMVYFFLPKDCLLLGRATGTLPCSTSAQSIFLFNLQRKLTVVVNYAQNIIITTHSVG